MEWQPIETAPKDGTPVILAVAGTKYHARSGWYSTELKRWVFSEMIENGIKKAVISQMALTHWMPLPEPPKTNE